MYVEVYKNLHKNCFSIRKNGKAIAHSKSLVIKNAKFVVQPSGRKRVLKEKRKNVHALVRGNLSSFKGLNENFGLEVSYNPYKFSYFYKKSDLKPVYFADVVIFSKNKVKILDN